MKKLLLTVLLLALPALARAEATVQDLLTVYRQALASDPLWASAQSANLATQEKLVQGRALTLPSATLSANANHARTDVRFNGASVFNTGGHERFDTYGYSVNLSHPLYRKQNSIQYEQSKTQVVQAAELMDEARQDLMLRVSQAYFDVLLAQDRIDLIAAQKNAIGRQLEQAQANFEVGTATITDVHEAQARFDLTVAQEVAALNDLESKKRVIQSLTGQFHERLAGTGAPVPVAMPEPIDMEKWVEIAEQGNRALKIQLQALELADQEIERTKAGHLPTLDVVGNYSDTRSNGGINGFGNDLKDFTVGLQFELPLYAGGAITSRAREAVANRQRALDDVENARRQAGLAARQAYLGVSSTVAQVKAFEQALASSQSQLDSTTLGYEVGVRTSVDVLNAQQQLYTAKYDLQQARYAYLVGTIRLKAAVGLLQENDLDAANRKLSGS
jgi:outer membrane protein